MLLWNSPLAEKQSELRRACEHYEPENQEKCFCIMNSIAKHDSSWGTVAIGKKYNNPGNVRCRATPKHNAECVPKKSEKYPWGSVTGPWSKFPTFTDGIWGNVELYADIYKDMNPDQIIKVWVQTTDPNGQYAQAVRSCF